MLLRNVSYIDAYTKLKLDNDFCGKRKFQRHRKLVSPIKRYEFTFMISFILIIIYNFACLNILVDIRNGLHEIKDKTKNYRQEEIQAKKAQDEAKPNY